MDIAQLNQLYDQARAVDDFDVHQRLIKGLLESNDRNIVEYHYELLRDRTNRDLYLRLRNAFAKRGRAVADFLVARARSEADSAMRADILHLLGLLEHPVALHMAREALTSQDPDLRHRACYVLGWLGEAQDIPRLRNVLINDPDSLVRRTAATAHSQFYYHAKRSKDALLKNLFNGLRSEMDLTVAGWIVFAVQEITEKRFGVKWDRDEDEIRGDITSAREKCLRTLARMFNE